jgi:hypothetical protein
VAQQRRLQRPHRATSRRGNVAPNREHRSGPGLGVLQRRAAATVQQAGVIYAGDQSDERVKSGEPLGVSSLARGSQGWQRDVDDVWETASRLSPRARHTVATRDQGAVRCLGGGVTVGEGRYPPGERRYIRQWDTCWRHDRGGGEQAQGPDRATVRVDATGYGKHRRFATPTDGRQLLA